MTADTTPNPVSSATMSSQPLDTVISRFGPVSVTYTTSPNTQSWVPGSAYSLPPASIVTPAAGTNQFSLVTIARTVYAPLAPTNSTVYVVSYSGTTSGYAVTTQKSSQAIITTNVTAYGIAIPGVNTTVFGAINSAQSLLTVANDIVSLGSQNVAVDRES